LSLSFCVVCLSCSFGLFHSLPLSRNTEVNSIWIDKNICYDDNFQCQRDEAMGSLVSTHKMCSDLYTELNIVRLIISKGNGQFGYYTQKQQ
jgi:hypothetical protein